MNSPRHSLVACLLIVANPVAADVFVRNDIITRPSIEKFSVCFDHTCETVVTRSLTRQEWQRVTAFLLPAAHSAAEERHAIARSIAMMESLVGSKTGTGLDKGGNLAGFGQPGQMDCIDESTNATTYLRMLETEGLLRFHTVVDRSTRFGLFVGMPHTTAVIRETGTRRRYAVDSWFFDNGQPPAIVELSAWKSGWRPGKQDDD